MKNNPVGTTELVLSEHIYSRAAAMLAAQVLSGRAVLKIGASSGGDYAVRLASPEADRAAAEFINEVLNQQCRIDLENKKSAVAGMITVKALLSAAGNGRQAGKDKKGGKNNE